MFSTPLYKLSIIDRPLAKGKGEVWHTCTKTFTPEHHYCSVCIQL